jgi:hypothetical protein
MTQEGDGRKWMRPEARSIAADASGDHVLLELRQPIVTLSCWSSFGV